MPARNVTRCRRKVAAELDLLDELNLVYWIPLLPGSQFKSLAAMRYAWERHGGEILPHYIEQRPGTRPFVLWALGELPLPALKHEPHEQSLQTVIDGVIYFSPWHYWGTRTGRHGYYLGGSAWGEFQLLRRLGVVDDEEAERAADWIDDREHDPSRTRCDYVPLSRQ